MQSSSAGEESKLTNLQSGIIMRVLPARFDGMDVPPITRRVPSFVLTQGDGDWVEMILGFVTKNQLNFG